MKKDSSKISFLRKIFIIIFIKNLPQKILAFIFGAIIWFFVGNQNPLQTVEYQLSIPVSYTSLPKNLAVTNELIENINIRVLAQSDDRDLIKPSNFQSVIDLENIKEGENEIKINQTFIQSDVNYKLVSLSPNNLFIVSERLAEKSIPVRVIVAGNLGDLVVSKIDNEPSFLLIKGPFSVVQHLEYIETQPININYTDLEQDFVTGLNIPKNIVLVEGIENISGVITLGEKKTSIRLENIPVFTVGSIFEVRSNPKEINFLISGPQDIVNSIKKEDLKSYIRLNSYEPGKYLIKEVDLNLPSEVVIKKTWPPINIWILNKKKNTL